MAVRHSNPSAKAQSGVILSGKDADKVFSMFEKPQSKQTIETKKKNMKAMFKKALSKVS
ncbi:MAG: hypothetical protein ACQESH_01100 [Campylobacterota bacterium]